MLRLQGGKDRVIFPENAKEDYKDVFENYIYKDNEENTHYELDPTGGHDLKPFESMIREFIMNPKGFLGIDSIASRI